MAAQFSSIQSYIGASKPNVPNPIHGAKTSTKSVGDGFTDAEIDAVVHPKMDENWLPDQEYEELDIASLTPGPNRVTFRGRIANYYNYETASKKPRAAKGCVRIIIKDDSGAITVRSLEIPFASLLDISGLSRLDCGMRNSTTSFVWVSS